MGSKLDEELADQPCVRLLVKAVLGVVDGIGHDVADLVKV